MLLQDKYGEPVRLGAKIAGGGEGTIFAVEGNANLVAKVYHKITDERVCKLTAMLANPPEDPMAGKQHTSIAWPAGLLSTTSSRPEWVGYLMPWARNMSPIFDFYNPGVRRQRCPLFDYSYLCRTACNLSSAVQALHARGYVIGDVNESNILVSDAALVTFVDTDSFQVNDTLNGVVYRCPVGKPEFTPPELQGRKFEEVDRLPEHDLFGLGIVIFQLLMEGTHPFAGRFLKEGDPPRVDQRISSGHFPHGPAGCKLYAPLPSGLPFGALNPGLQQLFLRCFVDGHHNPKARPDAQTWRRALQAALDDLRKCPANARHHYSGHLASCPWCARRKMLGGLDAFPSEEAVRSKAHLQPPSRRPSGPASAQRVRPSGRAPSAAAAGMLPAIGRNAPGWPLIRRTLREKPYFLGLSLAAALVLAVCAASLIHQDAVNGAYRKAFSAAAAAEPKAGLAVLQTVLAEYPTARQASSARTRIAAIRAELRLRDEARAADLALNNALRDEQSAAKPPIRPQQAGPPSGERYQPALAKAAEQGLADAQFSLGNCYYQGLGIEKDIAQAAKWYRKASAQGHFQAKLLLAEQGLADAQFGLGNCYDKEFDNCYDRGAVIAKDPLEAAKWYRRAAAQGHVGAKLRLAVLDAGGPAPAPQEAAAHAADRPPGREVPLSLRN